MMLADFRWLARFAEGFRVWLKFFMRRKNMRSFAVRFFDIESSNRAGYLRRVRKSLFLLLIGLPSCGGIIYTDKVNSVSHKLELARDTKAEEYAPFEYYTAKEHVLKAQEQASKADYGDAIDLLNEADHAADHALQITAEAAKKGSNP
jgi:hypothetical protein